MDDSFNNQPLNNDHYYSNPNNNCCQELIRGFPKSQGVLPTVRQGRTVCSKTMVLYHIP